MLSIVCKLVSSGACPIWQSSQTVCHIHFSCEAGLSNLQTVLQRAKVRLNFLFAGSFVVPGMLVTLYTLDRFGRKPTLIGGQLLASLCCFLIVFFPEGTITNIECIM